MQPNEFKRIREWMELSVRELAKIIRISDSRSVREYEEGTRPISGPLSRLMEYLERFGPPKW